MSYTGNGEDALKLLRHRQFEILLLDIQLPGMSGLELAERIKAIKEEEGYKLPIIAVSAFSSMKDMEKYDEAGIVGFIPKPMDIDLFYKTVEKWIVRGDCYE